MKLTRIAQCVAAIAVGLSSAASATTILTNEYSVIANATNVGVNTWQFDYSVTNNNQNAGNHTGLDGLIVFIPTAATIVTSSSPVSYNGAPGYWYTSTSTGLNLGGNLSQDLTAMAGYSALIWWGAEPASVYTQGSTALFSVTLSNVSVGNNTIGLTTYLANGGIQNQQNTGNQYGNYSTFTGTYVAPVTAVPVPAAAWLLGSGLLGLAGMTRRKTA